jgi:hypothetical protein
MVYLELVDFEPTPSQFALARARRQQEQQQEAPEAAPAES